MVLINYSSLTFPDTQNYIEIEYISLNLEKALSFLKTHRLNFCDDWKELWKYNELVLIETNLEDGLPDGLFNEEWLYSRNQSGKLRQHVEYRKNKH